MASWLSHLNPTPSFSAYNGPYSVGTIDVEIAASELQHDASSYAPTATVAFRCFYPCDPPSKPAQPVYWVQKPQRATLSAYARFLGAGSGFSDIFSYFPQLLYHVRIPAHRNAPLLPSPAQSGRWPCLVFSHGLGGSRNAYSHICGSLAAQGIVVLAPEHRDGSCPISYIRATDGTAATTVDYRKVSHKASPEVYDARDEQLRVRLWELSLVHEALRSIDTGRTPTNLDTGASKTDSKNSTSILGTFTNRLAIHEPGSIAFAGHSFGACTTVQWLKSLFYHPRNPHLRATSSYHMPHAQAPLLSFNPSPALLDQISPTTPIALLDLWTLPLNSPATASLNKLPMPFFTSKSIGSTETTAPILAICSSAFVNWTTNFNNVKRVLQKPKTPSRGSETSQTPSSHIFYPLSSAHLSQSDFGILFPRVTKYFAKADEPERTMQLNVRAIVEMLRGRGVPIAGDPDEEILSHEEGKVRGWIAVDADGEDGARLVEKERRRDSATTESALEEPNAVGDGELEGARQERIGDGLRQVLSKH